MKIIYKGMLKSQARLRAKTDKKLVPFTLDVATAYAVDIWFYDNDLV